MNNQVKELVLKSVATQKRARVLGKVQELSFGEFEVTMGDLVLHLDIIPNSKAVLVMREIGQVVEEEVLSFFCEGVQISEIKRA